jgi:hypothetical protein
MSKVENRAEILSNQYEFWMGIKHALGMAPKWNTAPGPNDSCYEGYSSNKITHKSTECFQERLDNIQAGWKTSDALLFASMLFSIPLTVFFVWGWCGNNIMQISAASSRGYWLEKLFQQSGRKPERQDNIQAVTDNCGTVFLSTNEDLDLPFWYSSINPPSDCENRESVNLTHFTEGEGNSKFTSTTRDAWLECLNTRIGGEISCPQNNTKSNKKRLETVHELIKYDFCPPNTTYYLYPGMRKLWWRSMEIAEFAEKNQSPPKPSLYVANAGSKVNGDSVSTIEYFSFWHREYVIAPLIAWKMWVLSGIYNIYGSYSPDVITYQTDYHKHGERDHRQSNISVEQCNKDREKTSNYEILAWLLTPLFPIFMLALNFAETFYMFFLVIVAFFTHACGRIWPLNWPLWEKAFRAITGFIDIEAAKASEKATYGFLSMLSPVFTFIQAIINIIFLFVSAIIISMLFITFAVIAGFIFGPIFTLVIGFFSYFLGPMLGGDSWSSGFAGHFMNIIGSENSEYPKWLYIRKYKFVLLMISIILTVFSKPVTMYLDPTLIAIILLTLIISVVFPKIGNFIGLTSLGAKTKTDTTSTPVKPT